MKEKELTTYPHDPDKEKNVDEKYGDGGRHVDPVVTVGRHPWTAGQEGFQFWLLEQGMKKEN